MEVIELNSAKDFVDYLRLSNQWWLPEHNYHNRIHTGTNWIFRGQSDSEWKLIPNAFRENCFKTYFHDFTTILDGQIKSRKMAVSGQMDREMSIISTFIGLADNIGIQVPLEHLSNNKLKEFYNSIPGHPSEDYKFPEYPKEEFIEAFALAQHHGVPTRLLDWSYNPLTAAFFSAIGAFESELEQGKKIAVWALDITGLLYENNSSVKIANAPFSKNEYIKSQRGMFTYDIKANDYFLAHGKWQSIDDAIDSSWKDTSLNNKLKKLTLDVSQLKDLLKILYREEISLAHLMPTLDNVNKTLLLYKKLFLAD